MYIDYYEPNFLGAHQFEQKFEWQNNWLSLAWA
jgi:hypothetical protein